MYHASIFNPILAASPFQNGKLARPGLKTKFWCQGSINRIHLSDNLPQKPENPTWWIFSRPRDLHQLSIHALVASVFRFWSLLLSTSSISAPKPWFQTV